MCESMNKCMDNRFPQSYFDEVTKKQKSASLYPILVATRFSPNLESFLKSDQVATLKSCHPEKAEGVDNLCTNIFNKRVYLALCNTDIDLYHEIFTKEDLYRGATHVLAKIATILCSNPPESVVESMGSIIERIKDVRGASKAQRTKLMFKISVMN